MKTLGAVLFLCLWSVPVAACEMKSPLDFIACYEQAIDSEDADALSALIASDHAESYLSEPRTTPIGRDAVLKNWEDLWDSDRLESMRVELGGSPTVEEVEPGVFRVDRIESTATAVTIEMSVGEPGTYTVRNWITWYLRETDTGFQLFKAEYWAHDPAEK